MMFIAGETSDPSTETVLLIESIVRDQVTLLVGLHLPIHNSTDAKASILDSSRLPKSSLTVAATPISPTTTFFSRFDTTRDV
jgi:hypothetical protein